MSVESTTDDIPVYCKKITAVSQLFPFKNVEKCNNFFNI